MKFFILGIITCFFSPVNAGTPVDLKECLVALDNYLSPEDQNEMLAYDESSLMLAYDLSLGNYIRNNWNLYDDEAQLVVYFNDMCIREPRQMSNIILVSYHRMKSKKLVNLGEQISSLIGEKEFKKCGGYLHHDVERLDFTD